MKIKKFDEKELRNLIEAGYESRNLEYKPAFLWKNQTNTLWIREWIVRSVLAMTNTRFGGRIILGISENKKKKTIKLTGVTDKQLDSFNDYDGIKGYVDGFSFSGTNFDLAWGKYQKRKFIIFSIQEFIDIPVICKKDGSSSNSPLRKFDIYSRSKLASYGSIRATDLELREIIRLAASKERGDLRSLGWVRKGEIAPPEFYEKQIKDLL